mmetsp:Transcript_22447/g.47258  ORF Transcript_22447/g.47258 Transcript_22447/m.47258 type:complete len:236 (+) Transcript_22447:1737-2444(+)
MRALLPPQMRLDRTLGGRPSSRASAAFDGDSSMDRNDSKSVSLEAPSDSEANNVRLLDGDDERTQLSYGAYPPSTIPSPSPPPPSLAYLKSVRLAPLVLPRFRFLRRANLELGGGTTAAVKREETSDEDDWAVAEGEEDAEDDAVRWEGFPVKCARGDNSVDNGGRTESDEADKEVAEREAGRAAETKQHGPHEPVPERDDVPAATLEADATAIMMRVSCESDDDDDDDDVGPRL